MLSGSIGPVLAVSPFSSDMSVGELINFLDFSRIADSRAVHPGRSSPGNKALNYESTPCEHRTQGSECLEPGACAAPQTAAQQPPTAQNFTRARGKFCSCLASSLDRHQSQYELHFSEAQIDQGNRQTRNNSTRLQCPRRCDAEGRAIAERNAATRGWSSVAAI